MMPTSDPALPQNDLEQALMDGTSKPVFVQTLLQSNVYFVSGEQHSRLWEFPDPASVENNKMYKFPFFTRKDRLMEKVGGVGGSQPTTTTTPAVPPEDTIVGVTGEAFFRMTLQWENKVDCLLSSGNMGFTKNFEPHEMEEIVADGGLLVGNDNVHASTQRDGDASNNNNKTMTVILGNSLAGQLPVAYQKDLQTLLSKQTKIRAVYCMRVRHTNIEGYKNKDDGELALILEFDSDTTHPEKYGIMEGVWSWSNRTYPGLVGSFSRGPARVHSIFLVKTVSHC